MTGKLIAIRAKQTKESSKFIYAFTFMFLFIFGAGTLKAQNNVNMLPDSGNVGIGTQTPNEKFEVHGNAKIHGKVKMTDSVEVEGVFETKQMKGAEIIESDTLVISRIMSPDSLIYIGDSTLVIDDKNRKIYDDYHSGIVMLSPLSYAPSQYSFACGYRAMVAKNADYAIAIGHDIRSYGENSFVIGTGGETYFSNSIPNSLAIGFNTYQASFFVGPSTSLIKTGNVGVSTTDPKDKFQIGEGVESITFGSALNNDAGWF
ncbi:MAG: hypothetical protein C0592_01285, partial [Marinilabiliales bacterium]